MSRYFAIDHRDLYTIYHFCSICYRVRFTFLCMSMYYTIFMIWCAYWWLEYFCNIDLFFDLQCLYVCCSSISGHPRIWVWMFVCRPFVFLRNINISYGYLTQGIVQHRDGTTEFALLLSWHNRYCIASLCHHSTMVRLCRPITHYLRWGYCFIFFCWSKD